MQCMPRRMLLQRLQRREQMGVARAEGGMTMDELKPCPFCGGKAEFVRTAIKTKGSWCDAVYVRCTNCDSRSNRVLYSAKMHKNDSEYREAQESWNRRYNNSIPATDVAPVVHGEWLLKQNDVSMCCECSSCGHYPRFNKDHFEFLSLYCPNCGAKMDFGGSD